MTHLWWRVAYRARNRRLLRRRGPGQCTAWCSSHSMAADRCMAADPRSMQVPERCRWWASLMATAIEYTEATRMGACGSGRTWISTGPYRTLAVTGPPRFERNFELKIHNAT